MHHRLPDLALPILRALEPVRMGLVVHHRLVDLLLAVQHERPVLHDLLIERQARHEEEAGALPRLRRHLRVHVVALPLEHGVAVPRHRFPGAPLPEDDLALERVREGIPPDGQRLPDRPPGGDGDVKDPHGGVGQLLHAVGAVTAAADDLHRYPPVVDVDGGDLRRLQVAVPRLAHLQPRGQVHPQLQADIGARARVRHLRVHDAPPRGHELQVPRADCAGVAGEVLVVGGAGEDVGDGFLAAVRVVGEAGAGVDGEVVEHEEGGEASQLGSADGAADGGARAFGLGGGGKGEGDGPGSRHVGGAEEGRRCEGEGEDVERRTRASGRKAESCEAGEEVAQGIGAVDECGCDADRD